MEVTKLIDAFMQLFFVHTPKKYGMKYNIWIRYSRDTVRSYNQIFIIQCWYKGNEKMYKTSPKTLLHTEQ
jgi:hypothetical protein